jgi:hypothetical protein
VDKALVFIYGNGALGEISLLVAFVTVSDLNTIAAVAICAVTMLSGQHSLLVDPAPG